MAVKSVRSVANALAVVEALAAQPGTGVSALARELSLDKMAVQRILVTLSSRAGSGPSRVSRAAGSSRRGSPGWAGRAPATCESMPAHTSRRSPATTGETVLLWSVDRRRAVVVDTIDSVQALRMTVPIGTEVPIHSSGLGPVLRARSLARRALPALRRLPQRRRRRRPGRPARRRPRRRDHRRRSPIPSQPPASQRHRPRPRPRRPRAGSKRLTSGGGTTAWGLTRLQAPLPANTFTLMDEYSTATLDRVFSAVSDATRRARSWPGLPSRTPGSRMSPVRFRSRSTRPRSTSGCSRAPAWCDGRVRGREHILSLDAAPLADAAGWIDHYRRFWSDQLASLDAFVTGRDNAERSS